MADKEPPYLKKKVLQPKKRRRKRRLKRRQKRNNQLAKILMIDSTLIKASSVLTVFTPCKGIKLIT